VRLEDLGLIGNCQYAALVERTGTVVWCCMPQFDSEPVFASLLDPALGGSFEIGPADGKSGVQRYLPNTNVLETTFRNADSAFRVTDFAPRFFQYDRPFRPIQLVRIVDPLAGTPFIRVRCNPRLGWSGDAPQAVRASNHVRYDGFGSPVRLTTNVPIAYLQGQPFALTKRRHLVFSWGAPVEEALEPLCERFLDDTVRHWQRWVKQCNIPPRYQAQTIRSALALKLHCFEDTGAIAAAFTTSIPEAPGSGRTWDYRYCWLRDSYYALAAFRMLGQFYERERFTHYLFSLAGGSPDLDLAPLYGVGGTAVPEEHVLARWKGYQGEGPVRVGNAAAKQRQNDLYGEMVLALMPAFLDERFGHEVSGEEVKLVERLARKAVSVAGTPDSGIWEYRTPPTPQTFSALMCWAAADRMATIAGRHAPALAAEFRSAAGRIRAEIESRAWNERIDAFASAYGGTELDASLLQMATLRFLAAGDPRLAGTVDIIRAGLSRDGLLLRYRADDGMGTPSMAFVLCAFWLVEALEILGRMDEAREVLDRVCALIPPLGLISEDVDTMTGRMWGNFPQAYSHVGFIHAAFAASPKWAEIL
jgi:GH15 family glucan-1,4-alpha-glucosidase